ncbi:DnaD domain-containing protein [Paenibacillus sp. strain BS8-2]
MAWIESHQELARHPKTRKLSRKLGISIPAAIGHLHMLWWWAIDYAQDGDLSNFDPDDIADALDWPNDANQLIAALIDSGFIDRVGEGEGTLVVHDWFDYAGRLVDKRVQNRERKRKSRANKTDKEVSHSDVTDSSRGQNDDEGESHGATVQNSTVPNQTEPNKTTTTAANSVELPLNPFKLFENEGFGTLSSIIADKIGSMIDDYGERWVCEAMRAAVVAGKRNLGYVNAILQRYKSSGVDVPWNIPAPGQQQQQRRGTSQGRSGKGSIPIVEDKPSETVSPEELEELKRLAAKLDGRIAEPQPF